MKSLANLNISEEFHSFLENLSEVAEKSDRIPFINREKQLEAVAETLLRKLKNNLLLIGEPGVGKTALITEFAARINKGSVPEYFQGKTVLELSLNALTYSRDSVETLMNDLERLFSELSINRDEIILFLDEMQLQSISGINKKEKYIQVQNLLKSFIINSGLNLIAATTPEYYYKHIKIDESLSAKFSPILINEPDIKEMMQILRGVKTYFEKYYSIKIPVSLFDKIYFLAQKFIPHRAFPHKVIEILDVSCCRASLKKEKKLSMEYIFQMISDISKLPVEITKKDPIKHSQGIITFLRKNVVNQSEALEEISRIIRLSRLETGINRARPEGIFLFLGETGVGKSFVASQIARYLFGNKSKLRIIDLHDYQKKEDVKKLFGDNKLTPGFLIHEVENHPFSVVLFENIDKASSVILDFLGEVLSKGEIIDYFGKKYFLQNIIFILSLTRIGETKKVTNIGFVKREKISQEIVVPVKILNVLEWVDEIVEFSPLRSKDLQRIAEEKIKELKHEIKNKYRSVLKVSRDVVRVISDESLKRGRYAHSVSEIINREIRIKLLDKITKRNKGVKFDVNVKANRIEIKENHLK